MKKKEYVAPTGEMLLVACESILEGSGEEDNEQGLGDILGGLVKP